MSQCAAAQAEAAAEHARRFLSSRGAAPPAHSAAGVFNGTAADSDLRAEAVEYVPLSHRGTWKTGPRASSMVTRDPAFDPFAWNPGGDAGGAAPAAAASPARAAPNAYGGYGSARPGGGGQVEYDEDDGDFPEYLDPHGIRYCQDKILPVFSNGKQAGEQIAQAAEMLRAGRVHADDFPRISVFRWAEGARRGGDADTRSLGCVFTEDNRRLWVFRAADVSAVRVRWVRRTAVDPQKLSTFNGGVSVEVAARTAEERGTDRARRALNPAFAGFSDSGGSRNAQPSLRLNLVRKQPR